MTTFDDLTDFQRRLLNAVASLTETLGVAPTYAELSREVGAAASTVHAHLTSLEQAGWVRRIPKSPRAVALTSEVPS